MLISSIGFYLRRSKSELRNSRFGLVCKFVTNSSEYCVPYPIIVCAEALVGVGLLEMLLRHTTLNICMYIHKCMHINKRERKKRERGKSRERERERAKRGQERKSEAKRET